MGQKRQTCCDSYSSNEFPAYSELSKLNDIEDQEYTITMARDENATQQVGTRRKCVSRHNECL